MKITICQITKEPICRGYYCQARDQYFKDEKHADDFAQHEGYENLQAAIDAAYMYWFDDSDKLPPRYEVFNSLLSWLEEREIKSLANVGQGKIIFSSDAAAQDFYNSIREKANKYLANFYQWESGRPKVESAEKKFSPMAYDYRPIQKRHDCTQAKTAGHSLRIL